MLAAIVSFVSRAVPALSSISRGRKGGQSLFSPSIVPLSTVTAVVLQPLLSAAGEKKQAAQKGSECRKRERKKPRREKTKEEKEVNACDEGSMIRVLTRTRPVSLIWPGKLWAGKADVPGRRAGKPCDVDRSV